MQNPKSISPRAIALSIASLAAIVLTFALISPIPQDPRYHDFADTRTILGISNFLNVASNLPFLLVGILGLCIVVRHRADICGPAPASACFTLFAGVSFTAIGSGYYHLSPTNDALFWDRLPMTIAFAGLFAFVIGDFISPRAARRTLVPLILAGVAAIVYWNITESQGTGDLRPYAIMQFLPMLLIVAILFLYKPASGMTRYYWLMLLFYVLAKLFEFLDVAVFSIGRVVSGHSMKHVFAALTPATVAYMLMRRRPRWRELADG